MADDKTPEIVPDKKPAPTLPAPPATPADVKKNPIRHPQIIALEKKVSELEDEQSTLRDALDGVNNLLEDLKIGSAQPVPIKTKKADKDVLPASNGNAFDEINRLIWGEKV